MYLWRQATERYGISSSDPICQDIQRLAEHWNDFLYARVERAFANYESKRNALLRVSERIPAPDVFIGELMVALVLALTGNLFPILIPTSRLTLHMIVSGLPGRGKTFFCRWLLKLLVQSVPHLRIVVFDPNRSYATTCADPRLWLSVPWDSLKLGVFSPPMGYSLERWLTETIDSIARGELANSKYLMSRLLDGLVASARRAAAGGPITLPSLRCLCEALASMICRHWTPDERYRQSALNVLYGRLSTTGNVFDCAVGMESVLADTRVRISTEGLAPLESLEFLLTHLIHYICATRETRPLVEPPQLQTLIIIEEAQTLLQKSSDRIAYYEQLLLRARALGVGFVFVTQDISRVDPLVLAACSNYAVFGQGSYEDKRVWQNILDLSAREAAMLSDLSVGECFIRFSGHSTFPWPFLGRIPDVRNL
jgi:hypothetical protein